MAKNPLITLLASGQFHLAHELAQAVGLSQAALARQIGELELRGVSVEFVEGMGYRIPAGVELLTAARISAGLDQRASGLLRQLVIDDVIDSTNAEAQRRIGAGAGAGLVCTAEQQSAGRGRRGRHWVSPYARNLYFSVVGEYQRGAAALEGMSLAVGVAVVRALEACGVVGVELKWPNDILYQGAKLGGILLEIVGDAFGPCNVVVGVGLNVAMPGEAAKTIDQDWVDVATLAAAAAMPCPGRNELLAASLNEILPLVENFAETGFAPWQAQWQVLDAHRNQPVVLTSGREKLAGLARGVDERGALRLETSLGVQSVIGGEISLRAVQ